jgi:hypothetical protein
LLALALLAAWGQFSRRVRYATIHRRVN